MGSFKDIREINQDLTFSRKKIEDYTDENISSEPYNAQPVYDKLNKCYMEEE